MKLNVNPMGLLDQAMVNFFIGFGLALLNVILRYFFKIVPRIASVTRWHKPGRPWARHLIMAYMFALIIQIVTAPFFRSLLHSVYNEWAWSFYQAFWNVVGVLLIDLMVGAWTKTRSGIQASSERLQGVKERASETISNVGELLPLGPEAQAKAEERRRQEEEAALQARADRKQRMEDRLKDY